MGYGTRAEACQAGKRCLSYFPKRKGWKLLVHHNIGWYWTVKYGPISVYESIRTRHNNPTYHCLISDDVSGEGLGGAGYWSWIEVKRQRTSFENPLDAVKHEIKKVRIFLTFVANLDKSLESIFSNLGFEKGK